MELTHLEEAYSRNVASRRQELQKQFDTEFALTKPDKLDAVKTLLGRIGSLDWAMEGYESPENQRDLSIKFHWGHNHRFSDTVEAVGRMGDRHISLLAEFIDGFGLSQDYFLRKNVLDVGCWTGGTTLSLKQMAAAEIVALEEVKKYAHAANELFRIYELADVECLSASLYNFEEGEFDLVYFPGVIYHLSDPVLGLRRLFNRLKDGGEILVESEGVNEDRPFCWFHGNRRYHEGSEDGEFNRGGWNWFVPTPRCLGLWMEEAGFEDVSVFYSPVSDRVFAKGTRKRYQDITRAGLSVPDVE